MLDWVDRPAEMVLGFDSGLDSLDVVVSVRVPFLTLMFDWFGGLVMGFERREWVMKEGEGECVSSR